MHVRLWIFCNGNSPPAYANGIFLGVNDLNPISGSWLVQAEKPGLKKPDKHHVI